MNRIKASFLFTSINKYTLLPMKMYAKRLEIMSWFWTIIFLSLACSNSCQGKHRKKPSAVIVGAVYCDTCLVKNFPIPKARHFIAGASLAVECADTTRSGGFTFRQQVKTDSHGEFKVHLPFSVGKHVNKIKKCSVRLISSNVPYCAVAGRSGPATSSFRLKSRTRGAHIFSAGFFAFKPLIQPQVCDQKLSINNNFNTLPSTDEKSSPNDLPLPVAPWADGSLVGGFLPPLPPLPSLPRIPFFPPAAPGKEVAAAEVSQRSDNRVNQPESLPFPPNPFNPTFPPNPFQPPPSVIPPLFPSPPPSLFSPIFPAAPVFHLPPIPGLTPPQPSPPAFPFPLPPFPFQPAPGFPRIPPAEVYSPRKTGSP